MTISHEILLIMGKVLGKICRENQNTHFVFIKSSAVYEIMSKNVVQPEGPQMTKLWRMRVACWISTATCALTCSRSGAQGRAHTHTHRNM